MKSNIESVIEASRARIAEIRNLVESEYAKIHAVANEEIARLEAYVQGLQHASRLDSMKRPTASDGRVPAKRRGRKPGTAKRGRPSNAAMAPAKRGRPGKTAPVSVSAKIDGRKKKEGAGVTFRAGSVPDVARAMIQKARKPIHLEQLVKQLGRDGKEVSLQSVENRISALARSGNAFVRSGKRIYGLIELGHPSA